MTLSEAVPYKDGIGMVKAKNLKDADVLQVMTDSGYVSYFLSNGLNAKDVYSEALDGKWLRTAGVACNDTIKAGQAFWYSSKNAKTTPFSISVAGSVLMTSETSPKECNDTYTLVGNPYACEVPINGGVVATGSTKAKNLKDADVLQVMTDSGYVSYFLSNGLNAKDVYSADLDGKWLKTAGVACTDKIPVGGSFWYTSKSKASTVKLINPIAE